MSRHTRLQARLAQPRRHRKLLRARSQRRARRNRAGVPGGTAYLLLPGNTWYASVNRGPWWPARRRYFQPQARSTWDHRP